MSSITEQSESSQTGLHTGFGLGAGLIVGASISETGVASEWFPFALGAVFLVGSYLRLKWR